MNPTESGGAVAVDVGAGGGVDGSDGAAEVVVGVDTVAVSGMVASIQVEGVAPVDEDADSVRGVEGEMVVHAQRRILEVAAGKNREHPAHRECQS
jgi:hypothetical protein